MQENYIAEWALLVLDTATAAAAAAKRGPVSSNYVRRRRPMH
jgi:hypothetical protein